jgi:hypothetical protein
MWRYAGVVERPRRCKADSCPVNILDSKHSVNFPTLEIKRPDIPAMKQHTSPNHPLSSEYQTSKLCLATSSKHSMDIRKALINSITYSN